MLSNSKYLIEEFEKEIWLYLDRSLPDEKMQYWEEKLRSSESLRKLLKETEKTLSVYQSESSVNIDDKTFERMVNQATTRKSLLSFLRFDKPVNKETESKEFGIYKIAFGSALAAAAIVIFLLSNKPNPVKNLSNEILDWDAEKVTTKIEEVSKSYLLIKDDELKKYMIDKLSKDKWMRDVYAIEKDLKQLDNEIKNASL